MRMHRLGMDGAVAGVTFVIAAGIYAATLLRGVSSADPAEMQTVPTVLGIAHPTTYPLWTLLGFAWTRLPLASPALLMNALSAALFAASAAGAAALAARLGVRPVLPAGGATFALSGLTWSRATQAEVHALHTLLMVSVLLAWVTAERAGSRNVALALVGLVGARSGSSPVDVDHGSSGRGLVLRAPSRSAALAKLRGVSAARRRGAAAPLPVSASSRRPRGSRGERRFVEGWLAAASAFTGNQTV